MKPLTRRSNQASFLWYKGQVLCLDNRLISRALSESPLLLLMWTTLSLLFLAFVVSTVIRRALQNKHTLPLPPSPQRHWLLGNVFDISSIEPWKGFRDLCTNYGRPHSSLTLLRTCLIRLVTRSSCVLAYSNAADAHCRHCGSST